jgi:hypothetical protein
MWVCPECKACNGNLADFCCVCGTAPDGSKKPAKSPPQDAVGVTRRFSVGTFMIMTSVFGVLFAFMAMLRCHAIVFADVSIFFAAVAAAQAILFGGQDPRKASWIAGFAVGPIVGIGSIVAAVYVAKYWSAPFDRGPWNTEGVIAFSVIFIIFGGPLGYVAGCLMAGIFLVRERDSDAEADTRGTFEDGDDEDNEAEEDSENGK